MVKGKSPNAQFVVIGPENFEKQGMIWERNQNWINGVILESSRKIDIFLRLGFQYKKNAYNHSCRGNKSLIKVSVVGSLNGNG